MRTFETPPPFESPGRCRCPARVGGAAATLLSLLATFSLVLATPTPSRAEDGPVTLRWTWTPGAQHRYRVTARQTSRHDLGEQPFETHQTVTLTYALTVQERDAEGRARITCRYERVALDLEQMGLGRVVWDSELAADQKRRDEPAIRPFAELVKRSFQLQIAPDGRVPEGSIEGFQKIRDAVLGPIRDQPLVVQSYEPAFSDAAIRATFERAFQVAPPKPVSPGASWSRDIEQPVPFLGALRFTSTLRLAAIEKGQARIEIVGKLAAVKASAPTAKPDARPLAVELESGSVRGEARFDVAAGWLSWSEVYAEMTLRTRIPEPHAPDRGPGARSVRSRIHQTLTVERLP